MTDATKKLAKLVADGTAGLPPHLYALAKTYTLDTLGVALFGSSRPWARVVADYAVAVQGDGKGGATILGGGEAVAPALAALANGTAGHAFEADDVHDESLLHPGTVVVPAALAVAEAEGSSGKEFLAAVILGYELMVRAGLGVGSLSHMMGGFHSTGTAGVFGAAASAALLLKSNASTTLDALGIAGSMASGIMEFSQTGGMVKRLHAGRAAEGGVTAAYLAKGGLTGPSAVLEGKYGFCNVFTDAPALPRLLTDLGSRFAIEEITVKPYFCCSDLHATIDAVTAIKKDLGMEPLDVTRITIDTYNKILEQNSLDGSTSLMAAQYSVNFAAAAALLHDLSDPATYTEDLLRDSRVARLQDKVELRFDPEFEANYPRKMSTRVTIETADGRSKTVEVIGARGHFENPLSKSEIEGKFRKMVRTVLQPAAIDKIIATIASLDTAPSLKELSSLLRASGIPTSKAGGLRDAV